MLARTILPFALLLPGTSLGAAAPTPFSVQLTSPRAGFLFTDSEPVDVRARLSGAPTAATIEYAVVDGDWRAEGRVAVSRLRDGAGEAKLPLKLPGRGLYQLAVTARSGEATAKAETWVAVVFTPAKPDPASPWAIFYTPHVWFDKANPDGPRIAAEGHRLLGASWSRLNFWAHSYDKVTVTAGDNPDVTAEYATWKQYARELRRQGISILGEIAQCPRELSSRPDAMAVVGDAGAEWGRVKPRDYALWERLMEKLARDFRDEIQVWEVWNEANLPNRYWTGSVEDFAELVRHTARGLRRGNPKARIAAAGFVGGIDFADRLFQLGMGKEIDILSVHYTDERPGMDGQWQALLKKHGLSLPIWNTEEKSEVPLRNLAGPIERSFKFIHVSIGYPDYRPLVRKDWTVLPAGILFSVGAHCIGSARPVGRSDQVPGHEVFLYRRGDEVVGAFQPRGLGAGVIGGMPVARLAVEPLEKGRPPVVTDGLGHSRPLEVRDGLSELPMTGGILFVNGCRKLEVTGAQAGQGTDSGLRVFEAESGRWSKGWGANPKPGFSGGRVLEIWSDAEPDAEGYWAEVKLDAPADATYEVLFSGNGLSRLAKPPSISPFAWSLDGGDERRVEDAMPLAEDLTGLPESPSVLGTLPLKAGSHTFRLKLLARRQAHDTHYALWFDAVVLRRR